MYCSNCGNSINKNLNYCNSCGARIEKTALEAVSSVSHNLSISVGIIGTAGLVGFIFLVKLLLDNHVDPTVMVIILVAYLVTLFLLCAVLAGHVWKSSGDFWLKTIAPEEKNAPKQFKAQNTAQLDEPKDFPASVTENTTRTLEEVLLKRS